MSTTDTASTKTGRLVAIIDGETFDFGKSPSCLNCAAITVQANGVRQFHKTIEAARKHLDRRIIVVEH